MSVKSKRKSISISRLQRLLKSAGCELQPALRPGATAWLVITAPAAVKVPVKIISRHKGRAMVEGLNGTLICTDESRLFPR